LDTANWCCHLLYDSDAMATVKAGGVAQVAGGVAQVAGVFLSQVID